MVSYIAAISISEKNRQQAIADGFLSMLRTTQHALRPEAAAAGGVGIADAVFLVFLKQLAMSAVKAGGELKTIELSAESLICLGGRLDIEFFQHKAPTSHAVEF